MLVDNLNPTNQFHPYQPPDATPHAERGSSLGDSMKNFDVRQSVDNVRAFARKNPALVLGGIAAAVIGAGLLRGRR